MSPTAAATKATNHHNRRRILCGPLYSGDGIAADYRWHEEAFELEVTVKVPPQTRAKDVLFKAKSNSIDLRLKGNNNDENDEDEQVTLLDVNRPLRGKVAIDGTFWVISDPDKSRTATQSPEDSDDVHNEEEPYREVTVTIEKQIRTPKDDFDAIEYDWKGVYKNDDEEVSFRRYDEPEELDVREYAASMGVDIDNLNMSM
ncbi:MAG: hypothetical protein SGARI_000186, partial [Bacillariaceae sp.]